FSFIFFFQAEDGIRDKLVTGVQTCALPIYQPLAAFANYAQACERLLARPGADLEEVRGALREIASQAVRAGDIIRRLRGLAGPHRGPRQPTDLNTLVTELSDLVKSDTDARHVRYRLELTEGLPKVETHATQIQQV